MEKLDDSDKFLWTELGQIAQGRNPQNTVMLELKLVPFSTIV